jgi:hypothetical protein
MKIYRKFKGEYRWFKELGFRIASNDLLNDLRHAVDEYKKVHEMKPQRIQLSRKKGFRLPPDTVVVARPSKWGNPFKVHQPTGDPQEIMLDAQHGVCFSREAAVNRFRRHIGIPPFTKKIIRAELRGKNLACWCPSGEPCHADVLLEIANGSK